MAEQRWISETLFDPEGLHMSYAVERVIHETQTGHQHLVLFEHRTFGKMLMLDGATQVTAKDEFIYHEMMTHLPIFAHGKVRDVLIVGGGDCGIAEEVLKHKSIKRVTQVEIDASVIAFAKQHFPEFAGPVFADRRFESVIDDGMRFVGRTERRFDVIIVDSTDPQGPGAVLFTREFYAALQALPEQGGNPGDAERRAVPATRRTDRDDPAPPPAVQGRNLHHRRHPDLRRRPHGNGLCQRQQQAAPDLGTHSRCALQQGRPVLDQILDARGTPGCICAAALHPGFGGPGESLNAAWNSGPLPPGLLLLGRAAGGLHIHHPVTTQLRPARSGRRATVVKPAFYTLRPC